MKRTFAVLLAVLTLVLALVLVSCDDGDDENNAQSGSEGQGSPSLPSSVTQEDLDELYSNIFGEDFSSLFGPGGEFPDEEV